MHNARVIKEGYWIFSLACLKFYMLLWLSLSGATAAQGEVQPGEVWQPSVRLEGPGCGGFWGQPTECLAVGAGTGCGRVNQHPGCTQDGSGWPHHPCCLPTDRWTARPCKLSWVSSIVTMPEECRFYIYRSVLFSSYSTVTVNPIIMIDQ